MKNNDIENINNLENEEAENQKAFIAAEYARIRTLPHKIIDGIPIELIPEELEEFNRLDPNQETITFEMQKNHLINLRKKYLSDTDWYLIREVDQPESYPKEVKNKRTQAREEINAIEAAEDLQQIELFISDFS